MAWPACRLWCAWSSSIGATSGVWGSAPSRLVQYLHTHVPVRGLIETPEYELAFLDGDHRIHLMPSHYFVESTPDRVALLNPWRQPSEFSRVGADILILGSFGKSVFKQVYPPALINRSGAGSPQWIIMISLCLENRPKGCYI
jgi:hypothetical protein